MKLLPRPDLGFCGSTLIKKTQKTKNKKKNTPAKPKQNTEYSTELVTIYGEMNSKGFSQAWETGQK